VRSGPFRIQPRGLIFGQTYEDSGIELRAFKPRSRVFSIAGAGCTARAFAAAGHHVTAVDINPQQLAYAESRAAGEPLRSGAVERLLALGRKLATLAGWSHGKLTDFLDLSDGAEQAEYWDRWLDSPRWRAAVDTLLAPRLLRLCYASPFVDALPRDFGAHLRRRLRHGWMLHANRCNPYAAALLLGRPPAELGAAVSPIQFVCADAADFLENSPATFDAFALSNIGDGAPLDYRQRLRAAMERAAAPGAVLVARSFAEPGPNTCRQLGGSGPLIALGRCGGEPHRRWPRGRWIMLHLLKRHPIPISAFFRHSLVLTYAVQPEGLRPLLPHGLLLDTYRGYAFLAVALVQTMRLRPSFLPSAMGRDFFLSGYRIFTRLDGAHSRRGLRILRSDTDRPLMVRVGNWLTHYNYHLCRATLEEHADEIRWTIRTPRSEADLEVAARLTGEPASLPDGSPFGTLAEARRFAGPLPYTFDYEEATNSIIGIRAMRQKWDPQPVAVEVRRNTFLGREPFCRPAPILANAFHVRDVPYQWERGRRLS
jgi:hypothetical protein